MVVIASAAGRVGFNTIKESIDGTEICKSVLSLICITLLPSAGHALFPGFFFPAWKSIVLTLGQMGGGALN